MDDQMAFTKISGDHNPVHIEPAAARRLGFDTPIVHGARLVLWALEHIIAHSAHQRRKELAWLSAEFKHPVMLNRRVDLFLSEQMGGVRKFESAHDGL